MPEIGEVARIVHFIREHLVGKSLAVVKASADEIVYGKVGTSGPEFEKAMTGKKVVDVGQQGKYFWMIMSSPPHPVMHFGMTGWFLIRNVPTAYYRDSKPPSSDWPPKFWKFRVETKAEDKSGPVEAAFIDARRLGRIRLVDCPGSEIRKNTPLKENGPDPVIDKDIVTEEWLKALCARKKVPVKAMLLDQANISGVGNWVGDEILYHAKIHPEQYANTLSPGQVALLHKHLINVTTVACETLAESEKFPKDWLMLHRWGKGKKDSTKTLPNGDKIIFLTVGGRTSAVVPAVQKKSGTVSAGVDEAEEKAEEETDEGEKKGAKRKRGAADVKAEEEGEEADKVDPGKVVKAAKVAGKKAKSVKEEEAKEEKEVAKRGKKAKKEEAVEEPSGRRRSGRVSAKSG